MKLFLAGAGILALILVISCSKKQELRPYNGHFVAAVSLHPDLVKNLVSEKQFDPAQNCIQLVEYSRTPDKSSRSDFYILFSANPCPTNNETVEHFAFASEVQGMEQSVNAMRLFNRLNELTAYNAVRPDVSSGWLQRQIENEKLTGYVVSEICNYSIQMKTTSISGCELRIENGRFAIPRDTSLTAKEDQLARTALDGQRAAKTTADENREDVIAHNNALHDIQVRLINDRFSELKVYLDLNFSAVNKNLDKTRRKISKQIELLDQSIQNQFKAQLARLNEIEKKVIDDLSKKITEEIRTTNTLVQKVHQELTASIETLEKKVGENHTKQIAELEKQMAAMEKLSIDLESVKTDIKDSTTYITSVMSLEMMLTNLHIGLVRSGQRAMADELDAKITELQKESVKETKSALKRATNHFELFKMIETQLGKLKDNQTSGAVEELKKSNDKYQALINTLAKSVEALEKKPAPAGVTPPQQEAKPKDFGPKGSEQ